MLDFVWLDARQSACIAQLNEHDVSELQQELFILRSKTGVHIDPYSDTRLAPDHARLLSEAIRSSGRESPNIQRFLEALDESVRSDRWILAVGD